MIIFIYSDVKIILKHVFLGIYNVIICVFSKSAANLKKKNDICKKKRPGERIFQLIINN